MVQVQTEDANSDWQKLCETSEEEEEDDDHEEEQGKEKQSFESRVR